jgi:hypothetical protein
VTGEPAVPTGPGPVTVAICTRNGKDRIGPVLEALAAQQDPGVPWRVLVIDNGSTDGTGEFVRERWDVLAPDAPLSCVVELEPGVFHARMRAFADAGEGLVVFVDDDNRLDPDYLRTVVVVMEQRPEVGAVGGTSRLPPGIELPPELEAVREAYAIGRPSSIRLDSPMPWGAGLAVRAAAFLPLMERGYHPVHAGRGDDTELCLLLAGMGWDLIVDERLTLVHAVDGSRLTREAFRQMSYENGRTATSLRLIEDALRTGSCASWPGALAGAVARLALSLVPLPRGHRSIGVRRAHAAGRLRATASPRRFAERRAAVLHNVGLARSSRRVAPS